MASPNKDRFLDGEALIALIRERTAVGQTVCNIPFRGISMRPMLRQGKDLVDFSPLPARLQKYDLPVYQMPSGKIVMHRVVKDKGDYYLCNGDNLCTYERVPHKDMIALVTSFTRNGKRIYVTSKGYRTYCLFWHYTRPLRFVVIFLRELAKKCWSKLRPFIVKD